MLFDAVINIYKLNCGHAYSSFRTYCQEPLRANERSGDGGKCINIPRTGKYQPYVLASMHPFRALPYQQ